MIQDFIDSICMAINQEFNDGSRKYEIYTESVEQGMKEPCFFVLCLDSASRLCLDKRYFRTNQFVIQYVPEDEEKKAECHAVAERLFSRLEYLDVGGDLVMGTKRRYEVVDGILHFFMNYDLFIYKVTESVPVMEGVSSETNVKG